MRGRSLWSTVRRGSQKEAGSPPAGFTIWRVLVKREWFHREEDDNYSFNLTCN
jgi:hypothetical protein